MEALERARAAYGTGAYDDATIEFLFPELKESEDERIMNFLIQHISEWIGCIEHDLKISSKDLESEKELAMFKAGLAYLKKQKEQPTDAKSKRVIKAARSVLNNWLDGTDCPDVSGDFAELEYAIREYDGEERQKEQKPSAPEDIAAAYQMGLAKRRNEQKPVEKQDYTDLNDMERAIHRGFLAAGVEDVPVEIIKETAKECLAQMKLAEWSEEDEKALKIVTDVFKEAGVHLIYYPALLSWLKSLRQRFGQHRNTGLIVT